MPRARGPDGGRSLDSEIIGIDLGSGVIRGACVVGGQPAAIPNRWGKTSAPSVVGWNGEWVAGEDALSLGEGCSVWRDIKRRLTRMSADDHRGGVSPRLRNLLVPLFRAQREDAEVYLDKFVSACALAVPCGFSDGQKDVMAQAAGEAGLREVHTVSSPLAAAAALGVEGRFLVLDFGAGAAEISVAEGRGGWRVVESSGGEVSGASFDWALAEWMRERLMIDAPQDVSHPLWRTLLLEAEAVKIALSAAESFAWTPPPAFARRSIIIEREDFERMARFPIRRLANIAARLWERHAPERLLLLGGSCNIPLLREIFEAEVAGPDRTTLCGEEAPAAGAAIYARIEMKMEMEMNSPDSPEPGAGQGIQKKQKFRELQARAAALEAGLSVWQAERLRDMVSRLRAVMDGTVIDGAAGADGQALDILDDIVRKLEALGA